MTRPMGPGGQASDLRRAQRSLDQMKAEIARLEATLRAKAAQSEVDALRDQIGSLRDEDDDGIPDALDLNGGGA